jgi:glycosyltransferase involved in cell wall biosynthesis
MFTKILPKMGVRNGARVSRLECGDSLTGNFPTKKESRCCMIKKGRRYMNRNQETSRKTQGMGIVLMSPVPPPAGGIGSWTELLLNTLKDRSEFSFSLINTAVKWRRMNDLNLLKRVVGGSLQALWDSMRLYRVVRTHRYSVLHMCTSASLASARDILMMTIAHAMGMGTVMHYHTGQVPTLAKKRGLEWFFTRAAMKQTDQMILLDEATAELVRKKFPGAHAEIIPNPVDPHIYSYLPDGMAAKKNGCTRIVFVGRVDPVKGIRELVQACMMLESLPFELYLVGSHEPAFREELINTAKSMRNGEWLKIVGEVDRDKSWDYTRDADIFAFPSHTEGFPYAILEAMAMARPIVATSVGGVPQMMDYGGEPCGILLQPRQVPELAQAIRSLINDPVRARAFGQLARKKVLSSYTVDKIGNRYADVWKKAAIWGKAPGSEDTSSSAGSEPAPQESRRSTKRIAV